MSLVDPAPCTPRPTLSSLHPAPAALPSSGLKFTYLGLRSSRDNPAEELSTSFTKAYDGSLKPHHGMLVRPVFYVRCCVSCGLGAEAQAS